jgi:alkanesulfonate monooxygenase SsuD/methylene tetrahydromethanopterin reductase-like flavin-dependent oxidoreductase (luciferase family)
MGAGWNESEHKAYGIHFPPIKERFDRLTEAIQVVKALWADGPQSFDGKYYRLDGADCMPKPASGRPTLLIGGSGEKRTLRLVAQHAAEWNTTNQTTESYAHKAEVLAEHCARVGRDPKTIRRSMMAFGVIGPDQASLDKATERMMTNANAPKGTDPAEFRKGLIARGLIVGSTDQVVERLGELAEHGLNEVEFQHFNFDDDTIPEYLASEIAPRVKGF